MFKILFVEDEVNCSAEINSKLKEFCQVHTTSTGAIAFNLATANKYDLVIIDINLHSGASGVETAKSIRKIDNYHSIPIVAYAINKMNESRDYLFSYGYSHLIAEPFNIRNFAQKIKSILSAQLNENYFSPLSSLDKAIIPHVVY